MVIDKINDMKMKLGNKVILRKTEKTKVGSELSAKAVNSAKRNLQFTYRFTNPPVDTWK